MKIVTVIGARPQFIKASVISMQLAKSNIEEIIIHTGQHFDDNMSAVFFDEMGIPKPKYNLDINALSHGAMTGRMLEKIEEILIDEKPDSVLVYGDTNSTLAGALAAKKLHIKVIHIEAGLRSNNLKMPEEVNRILTDKLSDILFCPTTEAVENLRRENVLDNVHEVGDVMKDSVMHFSKLAKKPKLDLPEDFILMTLHRQENTDVKERMESIASAINKIHKELPIVLPIHPRTRQFIKKYNINFDVILIDPIGYLEMMYLLDNSKIILTDSGGLQKEAFFFKKPCMTLRDETEWVELVDGGFNTLVGANSDLIYSTFKNIIAGSSPLDFNTSLYGSGNASEKIVGIIQK